MPDLTRKRQIESGTQGDAHSISILLESYKLGKSKSKGAYEPREQTASVVTQSRQKKLDKTGADTGVSHEGRGKM